MNKQYSYAVVIGRFQIPHKAHAELIKFAKQKADNVLVLIGSSNQPRTFKNPFTYAERVMMLDGSVSDDGDTTKVIYRGIEDRKYQIQQWLTSVRKVISANTNGKVALVGHHKDESSYYLDMFPELKDSYIEFQNIDDLNSTDIRNAYFEFGTVPAVLPKPVFSFLTKFKKTEDFKNLADEQAFIQKYKSDWAKAPYPPTFVTVDAVVIQSGHILLVKRRASPGKGLYALPGGFVNQDETLQDAMIRELREETKIKVLKQVLEGHIVSSSVFDDPDRSQRGRTITTAYLIELPPGKLPKVRGSDDAEKAVWVPLNEVSDMRSRLYEDHADIIVKMTGAI